MKRIRARELLYGDILLDKRYSGKNDDQIQGEIANILPHQDGNKLDVLFWNCDVAVHNPSDRCTLLFRRWKNEKDYDKHLEELEMWLADCTEAVKTHRKLRAINAPRFWALPNVILATRLHKLQKLLNRYFKV